MKYITKREMERIREKALTTRMYKGLTAYIIIETLANTGIRVHELIQMTPNDLLEKQIIIRGKGNKIRNIDVSPSFLFILKIHVKQKMIPPAEKIFDISRNGVYKLCKKVSGLNPHIFRHSYAIELLRVTKNIRYVQLQLGHSTMKTTEIYLRFMEYDQEKSKLGDLYKNDA